MRSWLRFLGHKLSRGHRYAVTRRCVPHYNRKAALSGQWGLGESLQIYKPSRLGFVLGWT